ncbi:hypothetical protein KUTeg_004171 [Tegillarca granosa]|uniref:Cadherin domain-containing protein n=1 Tax=Tegillarca granosa TaxID=220873 RepID=A0ABQ9FTP6_TEGGR|nr:hypothetical protein KUTeg_004171 [Tegillarca granosa]
MHPVYNQTLYTATISEGHNLGQAIVQTYATDGDPLDKLLYYMEPQAGITDFFYISPESGLISLKRLLTTETNTIYNFQIKVRDQSKPEKTGTSAVRISVTRNLQSPYFIAAPYTANINYNQALNQAFTTVRAADDDMASTSRIEYRVIGFFAAPGFFQINSNGEVSLWSSIAAETPRQYTLQLVAYDIAYPDDRAVTNLTVNVNRNPARPRFLQTSYTVRIGEDYALGVSLVQINATDDDSHSLTYSIVSATQGSENFFYLNTLTGLITVSSPLSGYNQNNVVLNIQITDNGIPPLTSVTQASVNIEILRNQFDPIFAGPFQTTVDENAPNGRSVIKVSATDQDGTTSAYGQLTYQLIGDENTQIYFALNANNDIIVNGDLTAENVEFYQGRVLAKDGGNPPRSATAVVKIFINRNLNAPIFQQVEYNFTIFETFPVGNTVGSVTANDNDRIAPYNRVSYTMQDTTGNNLGNTYFAMDPTNGRISVTLPLYIDNTDTLLYTFTVTAADGASSPKVSAVSARVRISVIRNLFAPVFHSLPYSEAIDFNVAVGTVVSRKVNATDADIRAPFNSVTYSLIGDGDANQIFSVDQQTGVITTKALLSNLQSELYTVRVVAKDGGTPNLETTATVAISVSRNLFDPSFLDQTYTVTIHETQDLGVSILALRGLDQDAASPFNTLVYSVANSDAAFRTYFDVGVNSGELYVKRSLLGVTQLQYIGVANLQDGGDPPRRANNNASITVNVIRNQHTPYFLNEPYRKDLEQNIGPGVFVLKISANDDDQAGTPFSQVKYRIIGDDSAPTFFGINENTGDITISQTLGGTNTNQYSVRVQAYDQGQPSRFNTTVAIITVKRNFQTPVFTQNSYYQKIPETLQVGSVFEQVNATDADPLAPNNVVRYSITQGNGDNCFGIIENTGQIFVKNSLWNQPCSTANSFQLQVTATDQGVSPLFATARVTIDIDRNRNPPIFTNLPFVIDPGVDETINVNTVVYIANATDADTVAPFNTVRYTLIGDDTATAYFQINSNNGQISVKSSIATDTKLFYTLRVMAMDGGTPVLSDTKTLQINVRRNLNPPTFPQQNYVTTIFETQRLGEVFFKLNASDVDTKSPYNVLSYSVVGTVTARNYFEIDSTGGIYVKISLLDRSQQNQYQVQVRATDGGTPALSSPVVTVTVNVIRNLNCPIFSNLPTNVVSIDQNSQPINFYNVTATDSDQQNTVFSQVSYRLEAPATTFFSVNSVTGVVTTTSALFNDNGLDYQLNFVASDGGTPNCETKQTLNVRVRRNLNKPIWTSQNNNYEAIIFETHNVLVPVYTVEARDSDDRAPNSVVSYSIASNSPNRNLFYIDSSSGQVFLKSSLVGVLGDPYTVLLTAQDGGVNRQTSDTATLTVRVNRNMFPPEILNLPNAASIDENAVVSNTPLYTVTTRDNDTVTPFDRRELDIIGFGTAPTYFRIDANTGQIFLQRSLSGDPSTVFYLHVRVRDGGTPRLSDEEFLTINVRRNLNPPFMTTGQYNRQILETFSVDTQLVQVAASDSDTVSPNDEIRFFIVGSNTTINQFFMVDEVSGVVSLRQSMLEYPNQANNFLVSFQISARDRGNPSLVASNPQTVLITVIRNTPPRFLNKDTYSATMVQFLPGGTGIFTPNAQDSDANAPFNQLTYSLIGDNQAGNYFDVNSQTGQITLKPTANLNATQETRFVVRIQVADGGTPPLTDVATVPIEVQRNLNSPKFAELIVRTSIPETMIPGSNVIKVNATDDDLFSPENIIQYVATGTGDAQRYFYVNPNNGQVTLKESVLSITQSFFQLTIDARDQGIPSRQASITVEITVSRDSGTLAFSALNYNITIDENRAVNSFILRAEASPGPNILYEVIEIGTAHLYFAVSSSTGDITVKSDLRLDRLTAYTLLLRATKQGVAIQTASATVSINVQRNVNAPQFGNNGFYTETVEDTLPVGSNILTVLANDLDGDTIQYSLASGQPYSDIFYINPTSGVISLLASLSTGVNNYTFNVQASDQQVPPKTDIARVHIIVLHDRFNPLFVSIPYNAATDENKPNGTIFYTVTATDQDLRGQIIYEVTGINLAPAFFVVHQTRGNISITNQNILRSDQNSNYLLRVIAYDSVYPNNRDTSTVTINVQRNLFAPQFNGQPYVTTIDDNIPLGTSVITINATDPEGDDVRFSMTSALTSNAQKYYYLNPATGLITLKRLLTDDTHRQDIIQLRVCDQRVPQQCDDTFATINIRRNEQRPTFSIQSQQCVDNLGQGVTAGLVFRTLVATDGDMRETIRYEITGDYPSPSFFMINETSGVLSVQQPLMQDSQQLSVYTLVVQAYDTFYPSDRATIRCTINVNRNPNVPAFIRGLYRETIPETHPIGNSVVQLNATDLDRDVLRFEMSANADIEDKEYFYVNPETGLITLKRDLRQQTTNQFLFDVKAIDPGSREGTATVEINVDRDEDPKFVLEPYSFTVTETAQINTEMYTVSAQDGDLVDRIIYGVIGELQAPAYFYINETTGKIYIKQDLTKDYENSHRLIVTAYDRGSPGKTATATVTITMIHNANPPILTSNDYSEIIWEYEPVGLNILNVSASDRDTTDVLRYEIINDNLASLRAMSYFFIDPDNGRIFISRNLRLDSELVYSFRVRVRDQQAPHERSAIASVTITVRRNTQSPFFTSIPYVTPQIPENSALSSSIFTVSARDNDLQGRIEYKVVGFGSAPYFFSLNTATGRIELNNDLRRENSQQYTLQVQAYDTVYPLDIAVANVTINILRNINPPRFTRNFVTTISEDTGLGVSILRVNATDDDGDRVTYQQIGGTANVGQYFNLIPDTGVIYVTGDLTRDRISPYTMTIRAVDNRVPMQSATVTATISIVRDSANPVFNATDYRRTISENQAINTFVVQVFATDSDLIGNITYNVIGNYPAPDFFLLDRGTGVITIQRNLRLQALRITTLYTLVIEAFDSARPDNKARVNVFITVLRNQNGPQWSLPNYSAQIREDHPVDGSVINVLASDTDPGDTISYGLLGETAERALGSTNTDYFNIESNTGLISLRKSVLNNDITRFVLTVGACDNGVPQKCANTTVTVGINRQGVAPVFTLPDYTQIIDEIRVVGTEVIVVRATDSSQLGKVVYEVVPPGSEFFTLDSATGNITLAKSVQRELSTQYQFKVVAYDDGEPQYRSTADVTVIVQRNLNAPEFLSNPYRETLDQVKTPYGHVVVNTTAIDRDGDVLRYRIENLGNSRALDYFRIDPDTGIIQLVNLLTNSNEPSYEMIVYARDQRIVNEKTGTATVSITITFDRPPEFQNIPYQNTITETHVVGSSVIQTFATDPNRVGSIFYMMDGFYPAESLFSIDNTTGEIRLIKDLKTDSSQLPSYRLQLIAYDTYYPNNRATATATVFVTRNPNAPVFQPNANYDVRLVETVPVGTVAVNVTATDIDNDVITYDIVETNPAQGADVFFLDSRTGVIRTKAALQNARNDPYRFIVRASDQRGLQTNASVTIRIDRIPDDKIPYFEQNPYSTNIFFTQAVNSTFYSVFGKDDDLKNQLVYQIVGTYPAPNFFAINSNNGQISLIQSLTADSLNLLRYLLRVRIYDTANPSLYAEENVVINVVRNPNQPRFTQTPYDITIPEKYPIGSFVLAVNATDIDNDVLKYEVIRDNAGMTALGFFNLNEDNGQISVTRNLRESVGQPNNRFTFSVLVRDQGLPDKTDQATVNIVIDRDRANPEFGNGGRDYTVTIPETSPVNATQIITVSATDGDTRENVVYEAIGDSLAMGYFWIDRTTGHIFVKTDLRTVTTSVFVLRVQAFDTYFPENRAFSNVVITVNRNPGNPVFSPNAFTATINEYHQLGVPVYQVTASDSDQDVLAFTALGNNLAMEYFYITPGSGIIYLRKSPSLIPSVRQFILTVQASDQRSPPKTANATITINITPNQAPGFVNLPQAIDVDERTNPGTVSYTVVATDSDLQVTGGTLMFSLLGNENGPGYFMLNETSGEVSVRRALTGSELQYTLSIGVYDSKIPTMVSIATLTINMQRNAGKPQFSQGSYTMPITDKYVISQKVGQVTATDPDGDTVTYTAVNTGANGLGLQYFFINGLTGEVFLIKDISTTQEKIFNLEVTASDRRNPEKTDKAQVTITVSRDESIPAFDRNLYTTTISETQPFVSSIISVRATDSDRRGEIVYEVIGDYPAPSFFQVNSSTGEINLVRDLKEDVSARTLYTLKVVAYDSAAPSIRGTSTVEITVNRNVNQPGFTETDYRRTISEMHGLGTPVVNISASDRDGDGVFYTLVRDNDGGAGLLYFYIDRNTGIIYLRRPLTESSVGQFSLTVRATDTGRPPRSTDVNVILSISRISPTSFYIISIYHHNLRKHWKWNKCINSKS